RFEIVHLERQTLDLLGSQPMTRRHLAREPDDRLVEPGRRIDLELHVEHFPSLAEARDDVAEIGLERPRERVCQVAPVAAGERVIEAALALERGGGTLEAVRGERRRPYAVARGLRLREVGVTRARALSLDQAAREARGERDRVRGRRRVEPEESGRRRRST